MPVLKGVRAGMGTRVVALVVAPRERAAIFLTQVEEEGAALFSILIGLSFPPVPGVQQQRL